MGTNYSPKLVTNGLILCLDAANTKSIVSGTTTWNDISRSSYDGVLTNSGVTYNSLYDGNISFSGTNGYVTLGTNTPNLYPGTNDFTISMWLNFGGFTGSFRHIWYGNAGGALLGFGILLNNANNLMRVEVNGSVGGRQINQSTNAANYLNSWHNWTYVINQSTFQILVYVDSVLFNTITYSNWGSIDKQSGQPLLLGTHDGSQYYYNGLIAAVQVYNRAITSTEVLQNYNALKGRFGL